MKYAFLSKKSFLLSLLILCVIIFSTISFQATELSYDTFMSKERELKVFEKEGSQSEWIDSPFLIKENELPNMTAKYPSKALSTGIYQLKNKNGSEELVCIVKGNFNNCFSTGNCMYISSGGTLFKYDLSTLKPTTIYSGENDIENIWGTEELVFFQIEDTIHHFYIPDRTFGQPLTVDNLESWIVKSNRIIQILERNPIYWEAVKASGSNLWEKPKDPIAFSAWLNNQFDLQTSPESKIFQECDVESILMVCGINDNITYWYDIYSRKKIDKYNATDHPIESNRTYNLHSNYSTRTSVAPTIWSYPTNTYFSDHKYTGCTCHNGNCSYSNANVCDCKIFESAIQCSGYARYVFYMTSGYRTKTDGVRLSGIPSPTSSTSTLRTFFTNNNMPIFIQGNKSNGRSHSVLVYAADSSYIYFCEANFYQESKSGQNTKCLVKNEQRLSYADFATKFSKFNYMIAPPETHIHTPFYDQYEGMHWQVCSTCFNQLSEQVPHNYGNGFVCICGAIAPEPDSINPEINKY